MKHFYIRDVNKFPVACVVSELRGDIIFYGVSVYNSKDQFNKHMAYNVAYGRLDKLMQSAEKIGEAADCRFGGHFFYQKGEKPKFRIMMQIRARTSHHYPKQVTEAVKLWLGKREEINGNS